MLGNGVHWRQAVHVVSRLLQSTNTKTVRVLELFAGTGALTRCLCEAAASTDMQVALTVVVDTDEHAAGVLRRQHPHAVVLQKNARDIPFSEGDYDIVIAGPPCQDFSVANQKRDRELSGIDLARGALLPFAARAIAVIQPAAWVIENVVLSRNDFADADAAVRTQLPKCLPAVKLCAAADCGAAMRRVRTFWSNVDLTNPDRLPAQPWAASAAELAADAPPEEWTRRCKRGRGSTERPLADYMHEPVRGRPRKCMKLHRDVDAAVQNTLTAAAHKGAPYNTVRDTAERLGGRAAAEKLGLLVQADGSVWRSMTPGEAERLMEFPLNYTREGVSQ